MVAMKLQDLIDNRPDLFLVDEFDQIHILINSEWAKVYYDIEIGTWEVCISKLNDQVYVCCLVNGQWQWHEVKL